MLRGTCFVVVTIVSSTLTTVPGLPFLSSLNQTLTMVFECFLWWMSHRDSVCTLCWELLSSESFFSRAASEKADILTRLRGEGETATALLPDVFSVTNKLISAGFWVQENQKPCGYLCGRVFVLSGRSTSVYIWLALNLATNISWIPFSHGSYDAFRADVF